MNENLVHPICKKCGKAYGMGIEERSTGIITPIDICNDCLFPPLIWRPTDSQDPLNDLEKWRKSLQDMEKNIIEDLR